MTASNSNHFCIEVTEHIHCYERSGEHRTLPDSESPGRWEKYSPEIAGALHSRWSVQISAELALS